MRSKIAPSILAADFARLGEQVREAEAGGADQIHVDVMDGHFVPNLSMGPLVVQALRGVTRLPLDVHLMITDPDRYVEPFVKAGADHVSIHVEASVDHRAIFAWLRERGVGRGLALNPETEVERVLEFLPDVDLLLVMTVHPGFGGQKFLEENLEKVTRIRREEATRREDGTRQGASARRVDVQVDGGVDATTIESCGAAGANVFVAGSAIFGAPNVGDAIRVLRERAARCDQR